MTTWWKIAREYGGRDVLVAIHLGYYMDSVLDRELIERDLTVLEGIDFSKIEIFNGIFR